MVSIGVILVDRHHVDTDPDPTFHFDADPDTGILLLPRVLHFLKNQNCFGLIHSTAS